MESAPECLPCAVNQVLRTAGMAGLDEEAQKEDLVEKLVFTDQEGSDAIKRLGLDHEIIERFPDFRITVLNGTFVNKNTRSEAVEMKYLLRVRE